MFKVQPSKNEPVTSSFGGNRSPKIRPNIFNGFIDVAKNKLSLFSMNHPNCQVYFWWLYQAAENKSDLGSGTILHFFLYPFTKHISSIRHSTSHTHIYVKLAMYTVVLLNVVYGCIHMKMGVKNRLVVFLVDECGGHYQFR